MQYIDNKFKDACPMDTVANIQQLLNKLNIETEEKWHESGLDNCWSLTVSAKGGFPIANGKGVSKEFARASAYGEFIERLQGGLFFYKFTNNKCNFYRDFSNFLCNLCYFYKNFSKKCFKKRIVKPLKIVRFQIVKTAKY